MCHSAVKHSAEEFMPGQVHNFAAEFVSLLLERARRPSVAEITRQNQAVLEIWLVLYFRIYLGYRPIV